MGCVEVEVTITSGVVAVGVYLCFIRHYDFTYMRSYERNRDTQSNGRERQSLAAAGSKAHIGSCVSQQ